MLCRRSRLQVVQYIELYKKSDEDGGGDGGIGSTDDSFTYFSDYIEGIAFTDDSEYYTYDDDSEYYTYDDDTWSEGSFCADFLDNALSFEFDENISPFPFGNSLTDSTTSSTSTPYSFTGGFYRDTVNGHGTWTAGAAAGAISEGAGVAGEECHGDDLPGCAGGCISASAVDENLDNGIFDLETLCPMHECDGEGFSYSYCLGDDPVETLHQHGGVAPGAKISVFDGAYTGLGEVWALFGGNHVWASATGTGARIHSNSWGLRTLCQQTEAESLYDTFMYEVRIHWSKPNDGAFCPCQS